MLCNKQVAVLRSISLNMIITKYCLLLREIPYDEGYRLTPDISGYLPILTSQYLGFYTSSAYNLLSL